MPQIILFIENPADKIHTGENIGCYLLADSLPPAKIAEVVALGKMVLCMGDNALEVCKKYNLDGVVKKIDVKEPVKMQLKPLREALKKKTLGVIVPARRHEAMLAGEVEPEFIAFYSEDPARDKEIISWYNELFLIPLVWVAGSKEDVSGIDVEFVMVKAQDF